MTAGGVGAVVGNPTEVSLVRMTLDGRSEQYSNNSGVHLSCMVMDEHQLVYSIKLI